MTSLSQRIRFGLRYAKRRVARWLRSSDADVPREERRINVVDQWSAPLHRSGWGYALDSLSALHHPRGILFNGFLDETFGWNRDRSVRRGLVPYQRPWIGFFHRPPNTPEWYQPHRSIETILATPAFRESAASCAGIFCLSRSMAEWLRERVDAPVCALRHPTEIPATRFDIESYAMNPQKSVLQIGFTLRKIQSFFELDAGTHEKIMVSPQFWKPLHALEKEHVPCGRDNGTVRELPFLSDAQYDRLLSKNIVFVHLYASSANNVVIECMARNTPILVNPLPAVVEYLGAEYPLYFETIDEAAEKLRSPRLIEEAHRYLRTMPKDWMSGKYFRDSFTHSDIYRALPVPAR